VKFQGPFEKSLNSAIHLEIRFLPWGNTERFDAIASVTRLPHHSARSMTWSGGFRRGFASRAFVVQFGEDARPRQREGLVKVAKRC
jgi:hypothetical protein